MKTITIAKPDLILIAGTRVLLGAGIALILADRFNPEQRRAIGWTLFLVNALSTIPLALKILHPMTCSPEEP